MYRLSGARITLENAFGICSSRFGALRKTIGNVKNVISITKAILSLHSYLINITNNIYIAMEEDMKAFYHSGKLAQIIQVKLRR